MNAVLKMYNAIFLKFTAKELLQLIKNKKGWQGLEELFVGLKDRTFQVWKRNSMSIDLIHEWFFRQKFDYLHNSPCQAHWQLATLPEDKTSTPLRVL